MMGYLDPENCVKAQLYLARQNGAHILDQTKIVALCPRSDNQVELTDSQGNHYITKKLIICAGAWVNEFLSDTQQDIFKVYRQTTYWFEVDKKRVNNYAPKKFPVYVWYLAKDNVVYGFPVIDDTNCVKVAAEVADDYIGSYTQVTPETVNRQITKDEEMQMFNRFVQPLFNGITNKCVKSIVCLYTVSPNWEFIIDYLPNWNRNIILASPCSGHGFKHSAAIGEALAELVIYGRATIDVISAFGGALSKK
jgi:sarcosine oxidase